MDRSIKKLPPLSQLPQGVLSPVAISHSRHGRDREHDRDHDRHSPASFINLYHTVMPSHPSLSHRYNNSSQTQSPGTTYETYLYQHRHTSSTTTINDQLVNFMTMPPPGSPSHAVTGTHYGLPQPSATLGTTAAFPSTRDPPPASASTTRSHSGGMSIASLLDSNKDPPPPLPPAVAAATTTTSATPASVPVPVSAPPQPQPSTQFSSTTSAANQNLASSYSLSSSIHASPRMPHSNTDQATQARFRPHTPDFPRNYDSRDPRAVNAPSPPTTLHNPPDFARYSTPHAVTYGATVPPGQAGAGHHAPSDGYDDHRPRPASIPSRPSSTQPRSFLGTPRLENSSRLPYSADAQPYDREDPAAPGRYTPESRRNVYDGQFRASSNNSRGFPNGSSSLRQPQLQSQSQPHKSYARPHDRYPPPSHAPLPPQSYSTAPSARLGSGHAHESIDQHRISGPSHLTLPAIQEPKLPHRRPGYGPEPPSYDKPRAPVPPSLVRNVLQAEASRKRRTISPILQPAQGTEPLVLGPADEPGIKNEFGRIFSGLGAISSSPVPPTSVPDLRYSSMQDSDDFLGASQSLASSKRRHLMTHDEHRYNLELGRSTSAALAEYPDGRFFPSFSSRHNAGAHSPLFARKANKVVITSKPVLDSVADRPRRHLGDVLYQVKFGIPKHHDPDHPGPSRYGFTTTPVPLPMEIIRNRENCTLLVKVPRVNITGVSLEEITHRRAVWGTDVYTDDSDVVGACIHGGWIRGAWPADDVDPETLGLGSGPATTPKHLTAPPPEGPARIPENLDMHVMVLILPCLERYTATTRFGLSSREWGGRRNGFVTPHDGLSFMVMSIRFTDGAGLQSRLRGAGRRDRMRKAMRGSGLRERDRDCNNIGSHPKRKKSC